jgi:hypothetical protein
MLLLCSGAAFSITAGADPLRDDMNRPELNGQRDDHDRQDDPLERNDPAREEPNQPGIYFTELSKCDALSGSQKKAQCTEAVRKRFGLM